MVSETIYLVLAGDTIMVYDTIYFFSFTATFGGT